MHIEDYKMTGEEFQELYKRVKRTYKSVQKFADHLKIGRTSIYEAFDSEQIPPDIDEAIDRDPELVKVKNKIIRGTTLEKVDEEESTEVYGGPSDRVIDRALAAIMASIKNTADSIRNTEASINQNSQILETVRDDNKFIKEDALLYKALIENIMQANNIVLRPKTVKS